MTPLGWLGRKTSTQTNIRIIIYLKKVIFMKGAYPLNIYWNGTFWHNNKLHSNTVAECHLLFFQLFFCCFYLLLFFFFSSADFFLSQTKPLITGRWYPLTKLQAPFIFNIICIFIVLRPNHCTFNVSLRQSSTVSVRYILDGQWTGSALSFTKRISPMEYSQSQFPLFFYFFFF